MFLFSKKSDQKMWLFVGLGNPGREYERNRHNIGFMVIDAIADGAVHFPPFRSKFQSDMTEERVSGEKVVLLKPQTYMNESGQAVAKAAKFYKVPPAQIVVFHDELDLKPGEVRVKKGGGTAGHNGLKSIQAHLGSADFWRVRIGIGHPGDKSRVSGYVLSDFSKSDDVLIEALEEALSEYYERVISEGVEAYGKIAANHVCSYMEKFKKKG